MSARRSGGSALLGSSPLVDSDATRWEGRGVRAEAVARQMATLRQGVGDEEGYALTRASVMNLIAYVSVTADAQRVIAAVDELAVRHPSRAIVLAPEPGGGFALDAEVVLHRHPMAAHGLIFERALLRPRGANPEGFDTLVIPLLIPHLQSFLWWLGDPDPADPALRSLVAICDRLIIDSAMGGPERLSPLSSALVAPAGGRGAVLGDMAWTRLEGYREALARIFDEGGRQRYLDGLAEVELTTPRRARDPLGSSELLLAGWLASRLGYSRPMPAPGGVSLETAGGARVGFHFAASRRASDLPIVGVRIAGRAGRRQLEVTLTEERGAWTLRTEETGVEPQHRRLPLAPLDQTEALSRELARMGRDRVYEDALQLAARIEAVLPAGGGRSPG